MAQDNTIKIYDSTPNRDLKQQLLRIAEQNNLRDQKGHFSASQAIIWLVEKNKKK